MGTVRRMESSNVCKDTLVICVESKIVNLRVEIISCMCVLNV